MLKTFVFLSLFFSLTLAQANVKSDALKSWAKRDDQQSLETALKQFEEALKENSKDIETLTYLARGYFLHAEYFMTKDDDKKESFKKAKSFGEAALRLNPEFKKLEKKNIEEAIDKLTMKEIAPLYWTAASIGKWARLEGIFKSLGYKNQIISSINKVEKLQPDFFYAAVPRYWGGFYAIAPGIAGGDMDKSKENFKKSMEKAPEYLGTKTLYAELYHVKKGNKKEFKALLEEVINSPDGPEDIAPENRLEKIKAKKLLEMAGKLF